MVREESLSFVADPAGAAGARRFTRECCTEWGVDDVLDTAMLLVSEVVTNAVLHGASEVELTLRAEPGRLRVEVRDDNQTLPVRKRYSQTAATGRGLVLLEALSTSWGAAADGAGKVVWFELDQGEASLLAPATVEEAAPADEARRQGVPPVRGPSWRREASGGALAMATAVHV